MPIPNKKIIIPVGNLKRYIEMYRHSDDSFKYSHQFWVRGHWVTFRHQRYKEAKGKKKWIYPFVKGEGIMINKKYELKKQEVMQHEN